MPEVRITAETRTEFGKGGARRTRRAGNLPAVLYGHGSDPRHISLPARDFENALRHEGANVLLELALADGGNELALPKSIQRDPVRGTIEHIDLILVRRGERITVDVSIQVVGDVVSGGMLDLSLTQLSVSTEATNIPTSFEVSIDDLAIGDAIHANQVTLPDGVELAIEPDQTILHIVPAPTAEQMESDLDTAAGEEAAEGEGEGGESGDGESAEAGDDGASAEGDASAE